MRLVKLGDNDYVNPEFIVSAQLIPNKVRKGILIILSVGENLHFLEGHSDYRDALKLVEGLSIPTHLRPID